MMFYKQANPNAFQGLANVGMRISTFSEVMRKMDIGLKMGMTNLVTVLFGLYSVKNVNIPMYATFTRY
jgi:hypothetical protein